MSTKPDDENGQPETTIDPERALMEWRVALLLSIVRDSGEVAEDIKVDTVTTSHPENPMRIKLDLTDGSEIEYVYRPRKQAATPLH